jgi:hypothetical protein
VSLSLGALTVAGVVTAGAEVAAGLVPDAAVLATDAEATELASTPEPCTIAAALPAAAPVEEEAAFVAEEGAFVDAAAFAETSV